MAKPDPKAPRLSEATKFGLRFFAILLGVSVFAWLVDLGNRLFIAQRALALAGSFIAHLTGSHSPLVDSTIQANTFTIEINFECTGVYVVLILFTFLLAYPASWKARLTGALVGAVGLTLVNILRIAFLIRIAELAPNFFDYFHEYVWQGLFLVLVIVYAMSWVEHLNAQQG